MPISPSEGSGQLMKTGCRYLCEGSRPVTTPPTTESWAQHPGMNMAMDGIAIYANWVSRVVMPIVFQWVDEHRAEMHDKMGIAQDALLPDDVDAVVHAAFEIVKEKPAYLAGREAFKEFQDALADRSWNPAGLNSHWSAMTETIRQQMRETSHQEVGPLVGSRS